MKSNLTFVLLLFTLSISTLQAQDYDFNQNVLFNKYIKAGEFEVIEEYTGNPNTLVYDMHIEPKNQKDLDGNPINNYIFTFKKGYIKEGFVKHKLNSEDVEKKFKMLKFVLAPENPFYPLYYHQMIFSSKTGFKLNRKYIVLNEGKIISVIAYHGYDDQNASLGVNLRQEYLNKTPSKIPYFEILGNGNSGPYKDFQEYLKNYPIKKSDAKFTGNIGDFEVNDYPGLETYYKKLEEYQKKLTEEASQGYQALLKEFVDGEYFWYEKKSLNSTVKIKINKEGGKVVSFTTQYPFTDGKYYDKEKMYKTNTSLSNKGYLQIHRNYDTDKTYSVIPFDGRLLLGLYDSYNKIFRVTAVLSKDPFDAYAMNLSDNKFSTLPISMPVWKQQNLETEYKYKEDNWQFPNYTKTYMKALSGK